MSVQSHPSNLNACETQIRCADLGTSIHIPAHIKKACIDGVSGCKRCVEYAPCTLLCFPFRFLSLSESVIVCIWPSKVCAINCHHVTPDMAPAGPEQDTMNRRAALQAAASVAAGLSLTNGFITTGPAAAACAH